MNGNGTSPGELHPRGFGYCPLVLKSDRSLTRADLDVYEAITTCVDFGTAEGRARIRRLAERSRRCERAVSSSVERLVARGYIQCTQLPGQPLHFVILPTAGRPCEFVPPGTRKSPSHIMALNADRADALRRRTLDAIAACEDRGLDVTPTRVAEVLWPGNTSSSRRSRVKRHLASLGYVQQPDSSTISTVQPRTDTTTQTAAGTGTDNGMNPTVPTSPTVGLTPCQDRDGQGFAGQPHSALSGPAPQRQCPSPQIPDPDPRSQIPRGSAPPSPELAGTAHSVGASADSHEGAVAPPRPPDLPDDLALDPSTCSVCSETKGPLGAPLPGWLDDSSTVSSALGTFKLRGWKPCPSCNADQHIPLPRGRRPAPKGAQA